MKIKMNGVTVEVKVLDGRKEDVKATMSMLNTISIALDDAEEHAKGNGWMYNAKTYENFSMAIYKALQEAGYYCITDTDI